MVTQLDLILMLIIGILLICVIGLWGLNSYIKAKLKELKENNLPAKN